MTFPTFPERAASSRATASLGDRAVADADRESPQHLAARIDAALPQTQCTRCGYPDCAAYAQAIAADGVPINQCPPGGAEGIVRLAAITGRPASPLNADFGREGPRHLAVIDEDWCIGCTLCIKACPTEAILGSNKTMHTVIEPWCTGCELCIPVCPVDCISLENATGDRTGWAAWSAAQAGTALGRYGIHKSLRGLRGEAGGQAADDGADLANAPAAAAAAHPGPITAADPAATITSPASGPPISPTAPYPPYPPFPPGPPGPPGPPAADLAAPDRKRALIEAALAKARARHHAP